MNAKNTAGTVNDSHAANWNVATTIPVLSAHSFGVLKCSVTSTHKCDKCLELQRTCVTAPARTAQPAVAGVPVSENTKKAPPKRSSTVGVMNAAVDQPRYWNMKRPVTISAMVAYPVAMDTSARKPCTATR